MAKFMVKLEITGLKLEIQGSREDMPILSEHIGRQLAQLAAPATDISQMTSPAKIGSVVSEAQPATRETPARAKKTRRGTSRASAADGAGKAEPIVWRHDPASWGNPTESWSTFDKAVWFLYVAAKSQKANEMTASQIALSFNQMFPQSGEIRGSNVSRDFGSNKSEAQPKVADDATKSPAPWYLLDAGVAHAEQLVAQLRSSTAP